MIKRGFSGLKRGFRGLKSGLRELACVNHTRKRITSKPWWGAGQSTGHWVIVDTVVALPRLLLERK